METRIQIGDKRTQFVYKNGRIEIWCNEKPTAIIYPKDDDFGIEIYSFQTMKPVPKARPQDQKCMEVFFI